jgi:WD40 repeat protein
MRGALSADAAAALHRLNAAQPELKTGKATKVHSHCKLYKEFTDLRLVQELAAHEGAVWTMKFAPNGLYLATAGQDAIVRVWKLAAGTPPSAGASARTGSLGLSSSAVEACRASQRGLVEPPRAAAAQVHRPRRRRR